MKIKNYLFLITFIPLLWFFGCGTDQLQEPTLHSLLLNLEQIEGDYEYISSPYVTAGNRLYMVGHQDGRFPDLGYHVQGEMGGIWDHPIKLMDGFSVSISEGQSESWQCLDRADRFINMPMANQHVYLLPDNELEIERLQFVPDNIEGLVIEFAIKNQSNETRQIKLAFTGMIDLLPVWLAEKIDIINGQDQASYNQALKAMVGKDDENDWTVIFGSSINPVDQKLNESVCQMERNGKGLDASLYYSLELKGNQTTYFPMFIAGSYKSLEEATSTFENLRQNYIQLFNAKKQRYQEIKERADIDIPDKELQRFYTWIKYNNDWLVREVPEIGKGIGAGLPDYPWWFGCDQTYTLQGVLSTGQPELAKESLRLLHDLSVKENGNGRIIHEASTNGVVYNPGNINETPHFASMLWRMYEWTGDRELLNEMYPTVKMGLEWLLSEKDKNKNLYPDGAGMMEIHGLHSEMIDVVVYTQQAFDRASRMAEIFGDSEEQKKYQEIARHLKEKINTDWWVEDFNSYADFKATTKQTIKLIEDAIVRADTINKPWAIEELEETKKKIAGYPSNLTQGHVVHHNWVVNTPMETGIAEPEKAKKALETGARYVNPFGVYVTGIDRDESQGNAEKWKSFSYVGAVMTLPTGVLAIAECNYGNYDKAYEYWKMLGNSFSYALPGSLYEVSPDYGMMVQAWNIYGVAQPVINFFFGIRPRAYDKYIQVKPRMPQGWDNAKLSNLPVGDNVISVEKTTSQGKIKYLISQQKEDWTIELNLPSNTKVNVNGQPAELKESKGEWILTLRGSENEITLEGIKF